MNATGSSLFRDAMFLPPEQARVFAFVKLYQEVIGEPCPVSIAARRLGKDIATVREHFAALRRKGWLESPGPRGWLARRP